MQFLWSRKHVASVKQLRNIISDSHKCRITRKSHQDSIALTASLYFIRHGLGKLLIAAWKISLLRQFKMHVGAYFELSDVHSLRKVRKHLYKCFSNLTLTLSEFPWFLYILISYRAKGFAYLRIKSRAFLNSYSARKLFPVSVHT